jgi:hypothetical protein
MSLKKQPHLPPDVAQSLVHRRRHQFSTTWHLLADQGECDLIGGAEYGRCYDAWLAAGCPEQIARWILAEANLDPGRQLAAKGKPFVARPAAPTPADTGPIDLAAPGLDEPADGQWDPDDHVGIAGDGGIDLGAGD